MTGYKKWVVTAPAREISEVVVALDPNLCS